LGPLAKLQIGTAAANTGKEHINLIELDARGGGEVRTNPSRRWGPAKGWGSGYWKSRTNKVRRGKRDEPR